MPSTRKQQAKTLRKVRKIHRITGITLFSFFLVIGVTGTLLGWKKNSNGYLLQKTYQGSSSDLKDWKSLDELSKIAQKIIVDSLKYDPEVSAQRIDVRKNKGIVKFIFDDYLGLQLDGATGNLLVIENRRSDLIENIHDGSIIDNYLNTNGFFKLIYTTIMGLALITFCLTGFWLWIGPKRMRKISTKN